MASKTLVAPTMVSGCACWFTIESAWQMCEAGSRAGPERARLGIVDFI